MHRKQEGKLERDGPIRHLIIFRLETEGFTIHHTDKEGQTKPPASVFVYVCVQV